MLLVVIYRLGNDYFQHSINDVFTQMNKWFKASKLVLNIDKTNFMLFATKKTCITLNIDYDNTII